MNLMIRMIFMIPAFVFHSIVCCVAITLSAERMATRGTMLKFILHSIPLVLLIGKSARSNVRKHFHHVEITLRTFRLAQQSSERTREWHNGSPI